jgi:hypothetical protein
MQDYRNTGICVNRNLYFKKNFFMDKQNTTINFPGHKKQALKIEAAKRGITMEQLVLKSFDAYVYGTHASTTNTETGKHPSVPSDTWKLLNRLQKKLMQATVLLSEASGELKHYLDAANGTSDKARITKAVGGLRTISKSTGGTKDSAGVANGEKE